MENVFNNIQPIIDTIQSYGHQPRIDITDPNLCLYFNFCGEGSQLMGVDIARCLLCLVFDKTPDETVAIFGVRKIP